MVLGTYDSIQFPTQILVFPKCLTHTLCGIDYLVLTAVFTLERHTMNIVCSGGALEIIPA